ncbi:MAG: CHAD domain-containing protein [Verrucomicrobiota bacterium]
MNPTLLASKSPGKDVQGILRRLVAGVARDIDGLPVRAEDRVHEIRVRVKKFRAVLRLAEPSLKRLEFAKSDKLARRLKDHFGSVRDDDVQAELLLDLLEKPEALATAASLGLQCPNAERVPDTTVARESCSALAVQVDRFHLESLAGDDIYEAWLGSYRRSRRAMRTCREKTADDSVFHEWRKRVKELLYQSAMIGPPLDKLVPKADRLASLLGSHHDLSILTGRLAGCLADSKAERAALSRKTLVARRALAMGRKLFAKKPSAIHRKPETP